MGVTETRVLQGEEYRSSSLRRPMVQRRNHLRLSVEAEGSVRFLESLKERRLLFGREQLTFFMIKAGILLQAQRPDWKVRLSPFESSFSARLMDSMDVSQRIGILPSPFEGYARTISVRNVTAAPAKVRLVSLQDPTAAHFRDSHFGWGSLGVNAFNRSSHIAMDEVAESPAARIVGASSKPKLFFMTTDREKANELLLAGELPEQTAGMSGQVLVLAQHDLEIPAGGVAELTLLSVYDPAKLEAAISSFEKLLANSKTEESQAFKVACSSASVTTAARWALSALEGVQYEGDALDRYEVLRVLPYVAPDAARSVVELAKAGVSKGGSVGYSQDPATPGLLETSALLHGTCLLGLVHSEKKYARSLYAAVKKMAGFLAASSSDGVVKADGLLPQGWRRRIGKGYPAGEVPELSLSVASALSLAASLASRLGKGKESAVWEERSRVIVERMKRRALDERGILALCLDGERQRTDDTVDQAVACYRLSPDIAAQSHVVRRLLEKDFESAWGPRTVPTSNRIYFSPSYGEGQLGGYWTRAALAHAIAAYEAGLAGIGSMELESVSKLPTTDAARLGCAPGDFPYWIDLHRREAHGRGSDPVSAARFLEALVRGELGTEVGSSGVAFRPSQSSRLGWLLMTGLNLGTRTCVFLGRAAGRVFVFAGVPSCRIEQGWSFSGAEAAEAEDRRLSAVSFFSPGQTVCLGNTSEATVRTHVAFEPRDPAFSKHLSASLLRLDPSTGSWEKVSAVRILSPIRFEVALGPAEWRAFRVSTGS